MYISVLGLLTWRRPAAGWLWQGRTTSQNACLHCRRLGGPWLAGFHHPGCGRAVCVWTHRLDQVQTHGAGSFLDIERTGWVSPPDGYHELVRRLESGKLSEDDMGRLVRAAVTQYSRTAKWIFPIEIRAINGLRKAGMLSPEQTECFFERLVELEMKARPVVSLGTPVGRYGGSTSRGGGGGGGLEVNAASGVQCPCTPASTGAGEGEVERSASDADGGGPLAASGLAVRLSVQIDEINAAVSEPLNGPIIMQTPIIMQHPRTRGWQADVSVAGNETAEL